MNGRVVAISVVVVVAALAVVAWVERASPLVERIAQPLGLPSPDATPDTAKTLAAAGVHKCRVGSRIVYIDQACPVGSKELAANGGTMTITSFPKPAPEPGAIASAIAGGALVKPMDREERDRLREKQIDDAANRQ